MGQKVSPIGLRVGVNKLWDSSWYASKEDLIPVVEMCKETVGVHVEKETRRGRRDV